MFEEEGYTLAESQYEQAPASQATGNVTLFAKADVIVISDAATEMVSASQLDALVEASETTRDWAIGTFDDDAAAAATYCENGGKIVAATSADIAGLRDAVAPVIADLKQDATTAEVITAIEELKAGVTAPIRSPACPETAAPDRASQLNGTYRWEVTRKALVETESPTPKGSTTCRALTRPPLRTAASLSHTSTRKARARVTPTRCTSPTSSTARLSSSTGVSRRRTAPVPR